MLSPTRRGLLKAAAALLPSVPVISSCKAPAKAAPESIRITDVLLDLDNIHKWDDSNGDTWDPFWADDDHFYAFNCDGRGFGKDGRNLAFNRLTGDSPHALAGSMINTMDEYGKVGQKEADKANWKVCGHECIDGVFYAFVSRNTYGGESGDYWLRQTAVNSSLIKSTDRGRTWTRTAKENYEHPMWPGSSFGAPFFIHYGKNGGDVARDGASRYVYAVSNNGFWNDGDKYILARIPREKLPNLNAADWQFFTGGDGSTDQAWAASSAKAKALLELRTHCGQSGPCYIPALGSYLMVSWYNTEKMTKWYEPNEMKYDFYQAPQPWGPWTFVHSYSDSFLAAGHMYGPSLCAKFQRKEGTDVHMSLFTSGCPFDDVPGGLYKFWEIPLILKTTPVAPSKTISNSDSLVFSDGSWTSTPGSHQAASAGATAEFSFTGTAIDLLADKQSGAGSIDVSVDGASARTVDLAIQNLPGLRGVTVFRSGALKAGEHKVRIVSKSAAPVVLAGFEVYS